MKIPKSYRDLDYDEVIAYADKKDLNTDSHENFREAAIRLFNEKYTKTKTSIKKLKKKVK